MDTYFSFIGLYYPQITIFLMILTITFMAISYAFPIHTPDKIDDNRRIILEKSPLLYQDNIILFESVEKCLQTDEILNKKTHFDYEQNIFILKFLETEKDKRFIIVILIDPNGIIRYSNIPLNENLAENFNISQLLKHDISNKKNIKISIPPHDYNNIYGEWHLNIYLYNEEKELTAIISKPINYSM